MKSEEVLRRYVGGDLDFRGKNIQGQSFQGKDLSKIDFSNAYIQGANFSNAILIGANFTGAKAGMQKRWLVGLLLASLFLSGVAGFIWSFTGVWTAYLFKTTIISDFTIFPGIFVLVILASLCFIAIEKGLGTALGFGAGTLAVAGTTAIGIAVAFSGAGTLAVVLAGNGSLAIAGALAGLLAGTLSIAIISAIGNALCRCVAIVIASASTLMLASALGSRTIDAAVHVNWASTGAILGGTLGILLSNYLALKTLSGDERFSFSLKRVSDFCAIGSTTFQGSDLTNAIFQYVNLKGTNLEGANIVGTCWLSARSLSLCKSDKGYLIYSEARQLVVSNNGQNQNFIRMNLEGINLQNANLQDASFIGTNLNSATLRNADLSRAILKQAQLDGTDMTGAILTGACIEDWGITGSTNLEGVLCDYVFMRLETKDNPNRLRKPDNWRETFAEGEFADFIKPYVDTLDLYHSQDIDPRAISIALKNLSTNYPEQKLRFVAIERRGNSGLNLRFTTAPGADKSELSHQYFTDYARIKKELPLAVQLRLAERDAEIRTLKDTIEQFIQTGTHQSKIQAETIQIIRGELIVTQNKGINIRSGGGSIGDISGLVGGDGVVNLGTISGSVTNTIDQLPDSEEPDEPNIKELLTQLQQAIENDSDLSDPDKADLLEQVQALAEAKQTEEPAKKEGLTRKARKMFEATLSSLPQTASIVEACSKLLPMILKALGLPA